MSCNPRKARQRRYHLLGWPIAAIVRRHFGRPLTLTRAIRRYRLLTYLSLAAIVVYVVLEVSWASSVQSNIALLSGRGDWLIRVMQCFAWLGAFGLFASVALVLNSWRDRSLWIWSKVWHTALLLASLCFVWLVFTWHLAAISLKY